jgi:hypothetical protein
MNILWVLITAVMASAPPGPVDREVKIGSGDQALYGSLLRPAGRSRPAVLLLAGSGPEDRNGDDAKDGQRSQTLKLIAEGLAEQDVTSLRIDKRGVGASTPATPPARDLRIGMFVDDAVSWARFLRVQPGVRCVVILGHSEGALIAALAAQRVKTCGVVSVSGAAHDLGAVIESQNALASRTPAMIEQTHEIIVSLRAGKPVSDVTPALARTFGPEVQAYEMSMINIDPVAELAKVKAPVLVLQGDNDLQDNVGDAKSLAARPGAKLVVLKGVNHVLKVAPTDMVGNFMTYANPNLPLAPGVASAIVAFVGAQR